MATWKTASELEALYVVSAERLMAYGTRGNLSFRRIEAGGLLFDEAGVARLFRARSGGLSVSAAASAKPGFGILGAMHLGQPEAAGRTSRDIRARAFRVARHIVENAQHKATG